MVVEPAAITLTATIPTSSVNSTVVVPYPLVLTATIPEVVAGNTIFPAVLTLTGTIPAPTVTGGTVVSPETLSGSVTIKAPVVCRNLSAEAVAGPNNPGTVADGGGDHPWDSYSRGIYLWPFDNFTSNYLKATNLGFAIPAGSVIIGIIVVVFRWSNTGEMIDNQVNIIKADGTLGATNKADTATAWLGEPRYIAYGTPTDLWGETWTATDINDADFGIALKVDCNNNLDQDDWGPVISTIAITVYYAAAP